MGTGMDSKHVVPAIMESVGAGCSQSSQRDVRAWWGRRTQRSSGEEITGRPALKRRRRRRTSGGQNGRCKGTEV